MFFEIIICAATGLIGLRYYLSRTWGSFKSDQRLDGQTVVITGANSGIGKATAKQLAGRGANIILACRDESSANSVINEIIDYCKHEKIGELKYKHLDLNSFNSVKAFANDLLMRNDNVNILINNAAVAEAPFQINEDDFERNFAVNHLSSALLTLLLMPKLRESALNSDSYSKIIFISSALYKYGKIRDQDFIANSITRENFDALHSYSNSKLAALLFAQQLAKNVEKSKQTVRVCAISPGIVKTNLGRHSRLAFLQTLLAPLMLIILRTPNEGAQTIIKCAVNGFDNGCFYRNCQMQALTSKATNDIEMKNVYNMTIKAINFK